MWRWLKGPDHIHDRVTGLFPNTYDPWDNADDTVTVLPIDDRKIYHDQMTHLVHHHQVLLQSH